MAELNLGVWQPPAELDGLDARLNWLAAQCEQQTGVDLALLPELFLSGYHAGAGAISETAGAQTRAMSAVSEFAQQHGLALALGYPEQVGGTLFNSACLINADGTLLLNHRKRVLPPGFETDCFVAGDVSPAVVEVGGVKVALLVCFEVEFPEAVRSCALAGAELVLVPTALGADWGVVAQQVVPARAFENTVFVAYANHAGVEAENLYLGESCIVGAHGGFLARAGAEPENLVASVDTSLIPALRDRLPFLALCDRFQG